MEQQNADRGASPPVPQEVQVGEPHSPTRTVQLDLGTTSDWVVGPGSSMESATELAQPTATSETTSSVDGVATSEEASLGGQSVGGWCMST